MEKEGENKETSQTLSFNPDKELGIRKTTWISIVIFLILSVVTIFANFSNLMNKSPGSISIVFFVILFNLSLGFLVIMMLNKLVRVSKRGYRVFFFYLILSTFFYWYVISAVMQGYYGTFLSLGGFYYFLATRTFNAAALFYICSALVILSSSFFLYFISRKYIYEKNPPEKIMNKKIRILIFLTPVIFLVILLIMIPKDYAYESSPVLDVIGQMVLADRPDYDEEHVKKDSNKKILDFSLDVEKPNFVIIMLESVSAEHMPYYGYERNITPNIDYLMDKSVVFENAYSSASHSDYAQTSFLSSRYTFTNDYRNFFDVDYPRAFMWDVLKKYNYTTAYISSQDDDWANMVYYYKTKNLDVYSYSISDEKVDYGSGNSQKDYDEFTAQKAVEWLNQTQNKNFFLYVNFQATHYPYEYPEFSLAANESSDTDKINESNILFKPYEPSSMTSYYDIVSEDYEASVNDYDNSVYYVDKQVGVLVDYLESKGLLNNTIIILSADHGEILDRRHGYLRHGFGVYEEEVKVPLMIYFPLVGHKIVDERVRLLDTVPTLLNITGFPLVEEFQGHLMVEGQNIYFVAQNQNYKIGLLRNNIKYMVNGLNYELEVYNLTEDPYEQHNLIETQDDEIKYYLDYGHYLYDWYDCQLDYYSNSRWENGEKIKCE